jgi:hypothetical protein
MKTQKRDIGWSFWLQWVLANTVGWIVGMALFTTIGGFAAALTSGVAKIISWGIIATIAGTVMGINQWMVLNLFSLPRGGRWAKWWVIVTIISWVPSMVVVVGLGAGERLNFATSGAIIGISMGIAQWFILRGQVERAEWWGIANTVGWMVGMAGIDLMNRAVGFGLAGAISGAITGGWLVWLLQHPLNKLENEQEAS